MQVLGLPCVATRERRRSLEAENRDATLKNFDFIISSKRILPPLSWSGSEREGEDYAGFFASPAAQSVWSSFLPQDPTAEKIMIPPTTLSWLVDIKGRRFPSGQKSPQYWRNWVSSDDLVSLSRWENLFGAGFHGLFVFVYDVCGTRLPLEENRLFEMNGTRYAFFILPLAIYRDHCHQLSSQWETVTMTGSEFRKYVVPLDEFFGCKISS